MAQTLVCSGQSARLLVATALAVLAPILFAEQARPRQIGGAGPQSSMGGFNNRAESVQVFGGTWELCDQSRFRGRCATVSSNVSDLSGLGLRNRVASVRPR